MENNSVTIMITTKKGDDPVRGYILVFCIALGCILLGDLNVVR